MYGTRHGPKCFQETLRDRATVDRARRFWQPGHPEAIQGERFGRQKLDYLHDNPCRKGLVRGPDQRRNSSAAWSMSEGVPAVDMLLTALSW